jgi:hydroxyacylglutathione hydrolase
MKIKNIAVGAFEVNCWIISNAQNQAIVIDPGAEPEILNAYIRKNHLSVNGYLVTHAHMDHISALAAMCTAFPAPIRMHPADAAWAFSSANQMVPYYAPPVMPPTEFLHADLTESRANRMGDFIYDVLETPGHSPGSVCLYFPTIETLFSGDTIVAGSAGRTDFPGGSAEDMARSLQRITQLPPKTRICPGHGPATTLAEEFDANPFLHENDI